MRRPGRHELAWLSRAGWQRLQATCSAADAGALAHWAAHDLPLVATRRTPGLAPEWLSLGLPAPNRWGRRRLALAGRLEEVVRTGGFPLLTAAAAGLPAASSAAIAAVAGALGRHADSVRIHGSHGWQLLTGLDSLQPASDLDLLLPAADAGLADELCRRLAGCASAVRLDGELLLPEGAAVAWREWLLAAPGARLLVKRLEGAELRRRDELWPQAAVA